LANVNILLYFAYDSINCKFFFYYKDSFLDLIYDYNETIDYYSIHNKEFFDGLEYKKYIVNFIEKSYSYSN